MRCDSAFACRGGTSVVSRRICRPLRYAPSQIATANKELEAPELRSVHRGDNGGSDFDPFPGTADLTSSSLGDMRDAALCCGGP